jgi:ABC-type multidrug transport system ATPase subunit
VSAAGEPSLLVRGLSKRFGERAALQEVDFEVRPGEMVAVIGPNGAGKTTLLSILAGVLPASEGEITKSPSEIG